MGGATTAFVATACGLYQGSFKIEECLTAGGLSFLFAIFPDVDIKSRPSFYLYSLLAGFLFYAYATGQYKLGLIVAGLGITPQLVKHRGIFHSWLFALALPASVFAFHFMGYLRLDLALYLYLSGVAGYTTHLLLDA